MEAQALTPSRIALSVPLVIVHSHSQVSGPVLASHIFDVQTFPVETGATGEVLHDDPELVCDDERAIVTRHVLGITLSEIRNLLLYF